MNCLRYIRCLLALLFLACCSSAGRADALALKDGSLLKGRITRIEDERLSLETDFAGDLIIPLSKVRGVTIGENLNIR